MNDQQVFKSTLNAMINKDHSISIDTDRYQGVLEHTLSKVDFSKGGGNYILPSNLNLSIEKIVKYNQNILISNTDMKNWSNSSINKAEVYRKKIMST